MNITTKQLMDIVSLSIEAVNSKADPTIPSHMENHISFFEDELDTPYENEVDYIIPNNHELAIALNEHIAAIRLGMRLSKESE